MTTATKIIQRILRLLPTKILYRYYSVIYLFFPEYLIYNEKIEKHYWDIRSSHWHSFTKPNRPSPEDMHWYKHFLNEVKNPLNILLLGSTPELRDLLADYYEKSNIYLIDFSSKMTNAMARETKRADLKKEILIQKNWIDDSLPKEFFNVIIGDLVLQQFPPELESIFLRNIAKLLIYNGIFITRCRTINEPLKERPADEIISEIIEKFSGKNIDSVSVSLFWRLCDISTDPQKRITDKYKALKILEEFQKKYNNYHPIINQTLEKLIVSTKEFAFKWKRSVFTKKDMINIFSQHLHIEQIKNSHDYIDADYYPMLLLKKAGKSITSEIPRLR